MRQLYGIIISFTAGALTCAALLPTTQPMTGNVESAQRAAPQPIAALQQGPNGSDRATKTHVHAGRRALSEDTVSCCLEVAADIEPGLAKRLKAQQVSDPEEFAKQLQIKGRRLIELCELRSEDPTLYDMKLNEMQWAQRVDRLGRELRQSMNSGNEQRVLKMEDQLRAALRAHLALEIGIRGDVVRKLEEHLHRLRAELDAMVEQFDQTVETRLHMIKNNQWPPRPDSPADNADDVVILPE